MTKRYVSITIDDCDGSKTTKLPGKINKNVDEIIFEVLAGRPIESAWFVKSKCNVFGPNGKELRKTWNSDSEFSVFPKSSGKHTYTLAEKFECKTAKQALAVRRRNLKTKKKKAVKSKAKIMGDGTSTGQLNVD